MTKLSVNLNKVALLRNQREIGYPDLIDHARRVLAAGADGITLHPRPDERHVRRSDIQPMADFIAAWNRDTHTRPVELNIEGYPDAGFLDLVCAHACHQVTLVPDDPAQKTSDHGWDLAGHGDQLRPVIARLRAAQRRVSLFIDPDPALPPFAKTLGADAVELYTGPYAFGYKDPDRRTEWLSAYAACAHAAHIHHLQVNAGHDLNLDNLVAFVRTVRPCHEVSIGHAITDDALKYGWHDAIDRYKKILT